MKMMRSILYSLLWFSLPLLWQCGQNADTDTNSTPTQEEHPLQMTAQQREMAGIQTGKAQKRTLSTQLQVTGMVDVPPQSRASLYPSVRGYIQSVRHYPGSKVRQGEILATLRHPAILARQQALLEAQAQKKYWAAEQERQQKLVAGEVGAQKALQKAEAAYQKANAEFEALYAEIEFWGINVNNLLEKGILEKELSLRSPINGYITAIHSHIGAFVEPTMVLYELIDDSHLHLELEVFAKDLHHLQQGQQVHFHLPQGKEAFKGEVYLIGREVDPVKKTVNVHVHYDESATPLTPGTYVTASIATQAHEEWAVPKTALVQESGTYFVYRALADGYAKVAVETGFRQDDWVAITVPDGDYETPLVIKGAYYLKGQENQDAIRHGH